jgi:hypothetical protein
MKRTLTSYPIPQPSTSFSNITRISDATLSSAVSQTSPSNWLSDLLDEADVIADAGNVEESDDIDDQDYIPDPAEAGSKGDNSVTSESSSLRTFWAGQTNSSLYSHPSETSLQTKTRVNNWMDSAKTSKNRTRASRRLASIGKETAPGTPETDTGGSFSEAPPAPAPPMAALPVFPHSPRPARPAGPTTRRSRLRPINTRPRSYILRDTTFRQYIPETVDETIVETVDLTKTESDSDNSSKKTTK